MPAHIPRSHLKYMLSVLGEHHPLALDALQAKLEAGATAGVVEPFPRRLLNQLQAGDPDLESYLQRTWLDALRSGLSKKKGRVLNLRVEKLEAALRGAGLQPSRSIQKDLARQFEDLRGFLGAHPWSLDPELTVRLLVPPDVYALVQGGAAALSPVTDRPTTALLPADEQSPSLASTSNGQSRSRPLPAPAATPVVSEARVADPADVPEPPSVGETAPEASQPPSVVIDVEGLLEGRAELPNPGPDWPGPVPLEAEITALVGAQRDLLDRLRHLADAVASLRSSWGDPGPFEATDAALQEARAVFPSLEAPRSALLGALDRERVRLCLGGLPGLCEGGPPLRLATAESEAEIEEFLTSWARHGAAIGAAISELGSGWEELRQAWADDTAGDAERKQMAAAVAGVFLTPDQPPDLSAVLKELREGRRTATFERRKEDLLGRATEQLDAPLSAMERKGIEAFISEVGQEHSAEEVESTLDDLEEALQQLADPRESARQPTPLPSKPLEASQEFPSLGDSTGLRRASAYDLELLPPALQPANFDPTRYFRSARLAPPLSSGGEPAHEDDCEGSQINYAGLGARDVDGRANCARSWARSALALKDSSWPDAVWFYVHDSAVRALIKSHDQAACRDQMLDLYRIAWDGRQVYSNPERRQHFAAAAVIWAGVATLPLSDEDLGYLVRLRDEASLRSVIDLLGTVPAERMLGSLVYGLSAITKIDDGDYFSAFYEQELSRNADNVPLYARRLVMNRFGADTLSVLRQLEVICSDDAAFNAVLRDAEAVLCGPQEQATQTSKKKSLKAKLKPYASSSSSGSTVRLVAELLLKEIGNPLRQEGGGKLFVRRAGTPQTNKDLYLTSPLHLHFAVQNTGKALLKDVELQLSCPELWSGLQRRKIDVLLRDSKEFVSFIVTPSATDLADGEPLQATVKLANSTDGSRWSDKSFKYTVHPLEAFEPIDRYPFDSGTPVRRDGPYDELIGTKRHLTRLREHFEDPLQAGVVLLYGRRRRGKTSILHWLRTDPEIARLYRTVLVTELQYKESPVRMLSVLAAEVFEEIRDALAPDDRAALDPSSLFSDLEEHSTSAIAQAFERFSDWFMRKLVRRWRKAAPDNSNLLLVIDEFQSWLKTVAERDRQRFAKVFNSMHQEPGLGVVLCGLSELPELIRDTDLRLRAASEEVRPLDRDDITELIRFRVEVDWSDEAVDYVTQLSAGNPFFVVHICSAVVDLLNRERRYLATKEDVRSAVSEMLRTPAARDYFIYMIKEDEQPESPSIRELPLLRLLAESIESIRSASIHDRLTLETSAFTAELHRKGFRWTREDIQRDLKRLERRELITSTPRSGDRDLEFTSELVRLWLLTAPDAEEFAAPTADDADLVHNRFRLDRHLDRGGFSEVWLAVDERLHDQQVVVKFLRQDDKDSDRRERFDRESEILTQVSKHPNILTIIDRGVHTRGPFIVTEHVEGENLRRWTEEQDRPAQAEVIRIIREMAEALRRCHEDRVIHKDLKPANIMIESGTGSVKLIDFGLAINRDVHMTMGRFGTPAYSSPEMQSFDDDVDSATDIFSLGVIAFELLAGVHPFGAVGSSESAERELRRRVLAGEPGKLPASVPGNLQELVMDMISRQPDDRPTAAHVLLRLKTALKKESAPELWSRGMKLYGDQDFTHALQLFEQAFQQSPSTDEGLVALDSIMEIALEHNRFDIYGRFVVDHLVRHGRDDVISGIRSHGSRYPTTDAMDVMELAASACEEAARRELAPALQQGLIQAMGEVRVPEKVRVRRAQLVACAFERIDRLDDAITFLLNEAEKAKGREQTALRLSCVETAFAISRAAIDDELQELVEEEYRSVTASASSAALPRVVPVDSRDEVSKVLKSGEDGHARRDRLERFVGTLHRLFTFVTGARSGKWYNGDGRRRIAGLSQAHIDDRVILASLEGSNFLRASAKNLEFRIRLHPESEPDEVRAAHERLTNHALFQQR